MNDADSIVHAMTKSEQVRMKGSHLLHMLSQRVPEHSITYNAMEASAQLECSLNEKCEDYILISHIILLFTWPLRGTS